MKLILRILKWLFISLAGIIAIAVIVLLIIGLPKPRAITSENVPRLPLEFAINMYSIIKQQTKSVTFNSWDPGSDRMYVWANNGGLTNELHSLHSPNEKPKLINGLPKDAWGIKFNPKPNNSYLIYLMDKDGNEQNQIFKFDLEKGKSKILTDGKKNYERPIFNKTGNRLAYSGFKHDEKNYDIYTMDLEKPGSEELLVHKEGLWFAEQWAPNTDRLIVFHYISIGENYPYIVDIENKNLQAFALDSNEIISYREFHWNNDESKIYYICNHNSEFYRLHVRNLLSGTDSILTSDINWDVIAIELSADGNWLAFLVNEDAIKQLYLMNLKNGKYYKHDKLPTGTVSNIRFHHSKNVLSMTLTPPSGIKEVHTYDIDSEKQEIWGITTKSKDSDFPDPELIHYPTFDFDSIRGGTREIAAFYHCPKPLINKPYPVFINIHGGPFSQSSNIRTPEIKMFLDKGIAVLVPNVRGSTGYGKTFEKLDNGRNRQNAVKDIGALLDWIETQPELDKNKIAVYGGSYGGYMSLACAVQYSNRITCAVDLFGISDFVTFLDRAANVVFQEIWAIEYGEVSDPEIRSYLQKISPINNVDKIDIPMLIYQGKNDVRVLHSQSRQMVNKLNEAGKDVWYIEASNEGHGMRHPMNGIYTGAAGFEFITKYLLETESKDGALKNSHYVFLDY